METIEERDAKYKIDLHGFVEAGMINKYWIKYLLYNKLIGKDDFIKEVDRVIGSHLLEIKDIEERKQILDTTIIHNTMRSLIIVNLAIKYVSYVADVGLDNYLDAYWKDRFSKFNGFGVQTRDNV